MAILIFRADGDTQIGLGHLYRCGGLSQILGNKHRRILFTKTLESSEVFATISTFFDEVRFISPNLSTLQERVLFEEDKAEVVILDGYEFGTDYQKAIKEGGMFKLISIDDLNKDHFYSDVLINHIIGIEEKDVLSQPNTKKYVGTDYAILREEFIRFALESKFKPASKLTIFVSMGGADLYNATFYILKILFDNYIDAKFEVLIGKAYRHQATLSEFTNQKNIQFHYGIDASSMINLIDSCSLVICPASTVSYEAMCINTPIITGYISKFQIKIAQKLESFDLALNAGDLNNIDISFLKAVEAVRDNNKNMLASQKIYFHGQQAENLKRIFSSILS